MIEFTPHVDAGWIEATLHGKIRAADFESLAPIADEMIGHLGKLNGLVLNAAEFSGWDNLKALLAHLGFVKAHHKFIRKVAFVGNRHWQEHLPKLAAVFVDAKLEYYPVENLDEARAWVAAEG